MKTRTGRAAKRRTITKADARRDPQIAEALLLFGAVDPLELSLAQVAADHVGRVLEACRGNISLASTLLGINRRSLQRWLAGATNKYSRPGKVRGPSKPRG